LACTRPQGKLANLLYRAQKTMNPMKQSLAICLSILLVWAMMPPGADAGAWPAAAPAHGLQEVYAPVPPNDMDALVAPIALYPDALVAQILGAATYPDQVEAADAFVKANANLTGDPLQQAAQDEEWDPAVMALLQFPSVLEKLAQNLGWTSALGDVSANQQADVMAAIQRMRAKAYDAGNLKSGQQIKVVKESPDIIVIQPANPQVVYVPTYNQTVIYGSPVVTPGYSASTVATTAVISFGVGIAVGAMINSSSCGWGYYGWRMNWAGQMVYCGGSPYYGNPYWWGGYYPGFRPGYRPPYYPPPRPPRPPPAGWRPPPPGTRPPYRPPGGRPPGNSRPPNPPPPGGGRPPTGGRPPGTVKPTPLPSPAPSPGRPSIQPVPNPGRPGTQPVEPGAPTIQPAPQPRPTTRPSGPGQPSTQPTTRELRGYPPTQAKPAPKPNAFSGSAGGRPESARGNRSLSPPPKAPQSAPARTPSASGSGAGGKKR
jgi:Protein of unknown function (DUF3300)